MEAKEIFDKIHELEELIYMLNSGTRLKFGDHNLVRCSRIMRELEEYCSNFTIEDLLKLYHHARNEKQFAVQYALLLDSSHNVESV